MIAIIVLFLGYVFSGIAIGLLLLLADSIEGSAKPGVLATGVLLFGGYYLRWIHEWVSKGDHLTK